MTVHMKISHNTDGIVRTMDEAVAIGSIDGNESLTGNIHFPAVQTHTNARTHWIERRDTDGKFGTNGVRAFSVYNHYQRNVCYY